MLTKKSLKLLLIPAVAGTTKRQVLKTLREALNDNQGEEGDSYLINFKIPSDATGSNLGTGYFTIPLDGP